MCEVCSCEFLSLRSFHLHMWSFFFSLNKCLVSHVNFLFPKKSLLFTCEVSANCGVRWVALLWGISGTGIVAWKTLKLWYNVEYIYLNPLVKFYYIWRSNIFDAIKFRQRLTGIVAWKTLKLRYIAMSNIYLKPLVKV